MAGRLRGSGPGPSPGPGGDSTDGRARGGPSGRRFAESEGGRQTGLEGPHCNSYYLHIAEIGFSYLLGPQRKPGSFGVGVRGQTGRLDTHNGGTGNGAIGTYLFGSQRLWFRSPDVNRSGVSGFYQFGANNSNALLARYCVGGGLTAFGLVPGRAEDSFGGGFA